MPSPQRCAVQLMTTYDHHIVEINIKFSHAENIERNLEATVESPDIAHDVSLDPGAGGNFVKVKTQGLL